jgi:hypothetical protein
MRKGSRGVRLGLSIASLGVMSSSSAWVRAEEGGDSPALAGTASDPAGAGSTATEHAAAAPTPAPAVERHGSAFVDPLGFALFGPRLGAEAGAGHLSIALYGRWFNGGLLSHRLFAKGDDELAFGYGAGLRGRYYVPQGLEGLHLGLAAEYLHSRVENRPLLVATSSSYFVPYAEVGYRLAWGRVYADASAGVGYALRLSGRVENLPGGTSASSYAASNESSLYGTASLDLGVFF